MLGKVNEEGRKAGIGGEVSLDFVLSCFPHSIFFWPSGRMPLSGKMIQKNRLCKSNPVRDDPAYEIAVVDGRPRFCCA
jgi:hypothetical protein